MQPQRRGRGRPRKKQNAKQKRRSRSPNPDPPHSHITRPSDTADHASDEEAVNVDKGLDTGGPNLRNRHTHVKPLQLDGGASDSELELEDDLPYGGAIELNGHMVDMMANLGNYGARDNEWLPLKEQRNLAARKKGK